MANTPAGAARHGAQRVSHTVRNVAEVARFGGLQTDEEESPYLVVAEPANYRLRHYFAGVGPTESPAILLVPPLMMTAEVWDVSPATSGVAAMHQAGFDPWVVDFGHPDREPGGLERTLTDHVLAVSDAVERVSAATGHPVVLAGYSQGGMFAYQAAAFRRGKDIDSIVTFGSPVDTTAPLPIPIAPDVVARLAGEAVDSGLLHRIALPSWLVRAGFKLLTPARSVQDRIQFLIALHDRDTLLPRERQRRFLDQTGWTAYSGPAIAELLEQFVTHNRMLDGGFVIDDRLVTLADIDAPVLTFVGQTDTIGHPDSVRAIRRAAPRATVYEVPLPAGHFGLVVGSTASAQTWPAVIDWLAWRSGRVEEPAGIVAADEIAPSRPLRPGAAATAAAQALELGLATGRVVISSARRAGRLANLVAHEGPAQLPKLARLAHLDPSTRISLGRLLAEQARRAPKDIVFLFGDRGYRYEDVSRRIDNVVRALLGVGVRPHDRVGVLMSTRPSAFTVVAALSRLGATAVLLRPDGEPAREAELAEPAWLISDPEHADLLAERPGLRRAVLGGAGEGRERPAGVIDIERVDPAGVDVPDWYEPNPHRASDIAFILFTGEGADTSALPITNRRWARSALGTASAATLKPGDTVYSVTPIHHSSTLLMSVGGAVAGGARFAMASADDPETFWDEVRRYGATHVSYTWASLRAVAEAAPSPGEHHHPIRLFMGSGMPRNLWRRVTDRFPSTRVLEFYASAEGDALLANLSGRAVGSMGRPLPGTAEVRVAACDLTALASGGLERGADGWGRECAVDEVGLLLARAEPDDPVAGELLRSVFAPGDAWRSTGDLFLRDDQGDLWLAGSASEVVVTADGPALPSGARFALGMIGAVDLVVGYGVPDADGPALVAALSLRPGAELTTSDLDTVLAKLPARHRPRYVQVVAQLPVTTWHRPQWQQLQAEGVPRPGADRRVWRLGPDHARYERVT